MLSYLSTSWGTIVWISSTEGFGQPANLSVLICVIKIETSKVQKLTPEANLCESKQTKSPTTYLFWPQLGCLAWGWEGKALQSSEIHSAVFLPVTYSRNVSRIICWSAFSSVFNMDASSIDPVFHPSASSYSSAVKGAIRRLVPFPLSLIASIATCVFCRYTSY